MIPTERPLTEEEQRELDHYLTLALELVPLPPGHEAVAETEPALLAAGVEAVISAVHEGAPVPEGLELSDISTALGVLWGDELCRAVGWSWVYLQFDDGLEGPAVVTADRSRACLPVHMVHGVMTRTGPVGPAMLFELIRGDRLPAVQPGAWMMLG